MNGQVIPGGAGCPHHHHHHHHHLDHLARQPVPIIITWREAAS
jgi:hypothetical protein